MERSRGKSRPLLVPVCDIDFVRMDGDAGGKFALARELAAVIEDRWPVKAAPRRFAVHTGGEPLLQVDSPLVETLDARSFKIVVESIGILETRTGIDWVCVTPKTDTEFVVTRGYEL